MKRPDSPGDFVFLRALMRCDESSRLFSESRDRGLSSRERLALWLHLRICRNCRCHVGASRRMFAQLHGAAESDPPVAVPEEIRRRVEARASRAIRAERPAQ